MNNARKISKSSSAHLIDDAHDSRLNPSSHKKISVRARPEFSTASGQAPNHVSHHGNSKPTPTVAAYRAVNNGGSVGVAIWQRVVVEVEQIASARTILEIA